MSSYNMAYKNNSSIKKNLLLPLSLHPPAPVSVVELTLSFTCLKQGTDLTLRCNINGFPRPTVTFSFDGNAITPGEGIYDGYIERTFYDEVR